MIGRLFRRKNIDTAPLARLVRHHRIGVNVAGDAIETARNRLALGAGLFVLAFAAISLRFVDLTVLRDGAEPGLAAAAGGSGTDADRAEIVDRNGVVLAMSIPTQSLFANPRLVQEPVEAARKLAAVLPGSDLADLTAKLKADKSFIWLKRNLTPHEVQQVNALGIPGIDFQREDRRVYPEGDLVSHVVGYAGIDNVGLAGVEQYFDAALRNGDPVTLSIDVRLQRIVRQEIEFAMKKFDAIGAAGLVLDVKSGEILAMVSVPGFDPNLSRTINDDARFNRVTLGVYEMGSTFKLFNIAMALDSGKVTMNSSVNASVPLQIDRFTIHDDHPQSRWLSVPEVIKFSSNIGSAKIAEEVGVDIQRAFFDKIGFLKPIKIELPESAAPLYPNPWRKINMLTISFGHGMAVTPLHLAMGVAGEVNNGLLVQPTLLRRSGPAPEGQQIISTHTARNLRQLMRLVVEDGTGKNAEVAGYVPGGKTGTSEKVGAHGGYRKKSLLSTFVGAFPMTDPRYVILVSIDEPKGNKESYGYATAGWVAAPAFGKILQRMAALYLIRPVNDPTSILPSLAPKKPVPPVAKPATAPVVAAPAAKVQGGPAVASN
ncbi:MAG: penicillin-binding protein 2 [Rhodospirillales bacterium]